jgi:hypothetical protein
MREKTSYIEEFTCCGRYYLHSDDLDTSLLRADFMSFAVGNWFLQSFTIMQGFIVPFVYDVLLEVFNVSQFSELREIGPIEVTDERRCGGPIVLWTTVATKSGNVTTGEQSTLGLFDVISNPIILHADSGEQRY